MKQPQLIIITGLPGTGKTTLGHYVSEKLNIPFFSKDDIKDKLFDGLGWSDREWSQKIGGVSYNIFYYVVESLLKANTSLIIETNFNPKFANKTIKEIHNKYNCISLQIRCITDGEVLFNRFKDRAESTSRHPGHADYDSLDEWKPILLKGKIEALDIDGELIDIDTTNFDSIDCDGLIHTIKKNIYDQSD